MQRTSEKPWRPGLREKYRLKYICQELEDLPPGFHPPPGREKPWGTGHAILSCRKILESPFAVINADDFYGREAFEIAYRELNQKKDLSGQGFLVGYRLDKTLSLHGSVTRGICETCNGRLGKIVERMSITQTENGNIEFTENNEKRPVATDAVVSMNFWGFPVDFMDMLMERFISFLSKSGRELKSEYLLPEVVDYFINKGMLRINVLSSNSQWFGVTYREDKPGVQAELAKMNSYPSPLW